MRLWRKEKRFQDLLDEKTSAADQLAQDADRTEIEYKGRLQTCKDHIEQLTQDIHQYKEIITAAGQAIRSMDAERTEALADQETLEKSCATRWILCLWSSRLC